MVSILGEYSYEFPKPIKLEKRLKDYLEDNVDEKYYLSDTMLLGMQTTKFNSYQLENRLQDLDGCVSTLLTRYEGAPQVIRISEATEKDNGFRFKPRSEEDVAVALTTKTGSRMDNNFIIDEPTICASRGRENGQELEIKNDGISNALTTVQKDNYLLVPEAHEGDGIYINRPHQKRGVVQKQMIQTLKTSGDDIGVVVKNQIACELRVDEGVRYFADNVMGALRTTKSCGDKHIIESHSLKTSGIDVGVVVYDDYNSSIRADQSTIGTLTTNCGSGTERNGYKLIENRLRIRKLCPIECWRLMGINDECFNKAEKVCSNSQLYKQAGNGIVVDVFMAIINNLI